jgi:ketosteroid isomerase-like protein
MWKDNDGMATIDQLIRGYFKTWIARDREAMERVVASDFHFTSPLDNRLDRQTFFDRCWPGGDAMAAIDIQRLIPQDNSSAFVTYELTMKDGRRFRNTEFVTTRGGQLIDVEVYFGWNIPHDAKPGGFVDKQK